MPLLLFFIQTAVSSLGNAGSADPFKSWAQIVAIIGGVAGLIVILMTRTWPWLKAKLERRSIQKRVGAEAFPAANIESSLRYYVPPYCQDIDPAGGEEPRAVYGVTQNLFEVLDDALRGQTEYRYLILLADSGMGKTSALLNYYCRHIRKWRRRRFSLAVVPLGIPNADDLIGKIQNKQDTVLFLDALDEDTLANVDHADRVADLLKLTREFSLVVITCRTQFFPRDEEIPKETGILKVGARKAGEGAEYVFHKLYLSPFTDEQVKSYLSRRYPVWRQRRRQSAFEMIKKVPNLIVRPMLLAYIDDLIRSGREIESSCDLYAEMVEAWLTREEGFVDKENLRQFSELLALDLYAKRQTRGGEFVPYEDLAGLAKGWKIPIDEWRLGSRSLLNRDAQGNYKFAHRSIMEYFCVKRFAESGVEIDEWTDQMNLFLWELFISRQRREWDHRINTAGWESTQCIALVGAVLQAEDRIPDRDRRYPHIEWVADRDRRYPRPERFAERKDWTEERIRDRRYRSPMDVLPALKEMMLEDSNDPYCGWPSGEFPALLTLVKVYVDFNELGEAEACGQQALRATPEITDQIKAFDALGNVFIAMDWKRRAIECYEAEFKRMEEIESPSAARVKNQIEALRQELETTCEFETVTLNASGHAKQRNKGIARQFTEELADGVALEMIEIPGGPFTMGAPREERSSTDDERPQHQVTISDFYIGKFTVTQAQWRVVAGWPKVNQDLNANPSHFKGNDRPVERVSWEDAVEFCARLSKKTGNAYRLPTEAEWEYACRAGTQTPFALGETITPEFVNYDGNHPYGTAPKGEYRGETVPVGSLGVANAWGLYDMHGNVWEWCQDWEGPYQSEPATDPQGPSHGRYRWGRGGSWGLFGTWCRSAYRQGYIPAVHGFSFGLRVVFVSRTP